MSLGLTVIGIAGAALSSLLFSTLTYALRDYSRLRLADALQRRKRDAYLDITVDNDGDLIFVTAIVRLMSNILVFVFVLHLVRRWSSLEFGQYALAVCITGIVTLLSSVAMPHAVASHAGEGFIASQVRLLHAVNFLMSPVAKVMHGVDHVVARMLRMGQVNTGESSEAEMQQEIMSVVEEGSRDGTVDPQEREMIESVIEFRATQVSQVMTALPDVVALPVEANLDQIRTLLEQSGHSRLPVYERSLDHIIGVLYARDLFKLLGLPIDSIDVRAMLRPVFFVPETKPLRDLLKDFRSQKVHLAIVLDEYGSTAGLATIEDVLEEIVGDITDEHEPQLPTLIRKIDDQTFEADARATVEEVNLTLGLSLPEDEGYETIGGLVSSTMGRIPPAGAKLELPQVTLLVIEAEPQRINRLRIELTPAAEPPVSPPALV